MKKILHIIASPRGELSQSNAVALSFLEQSKANRPSLEVQTLNLWEENLPEFDGDKVAAKMTLFGPGKMDDTQKNLWEQVTHYTKDFMDADEYVFAVPMWNGGIPYKLKQYIDIITQTGLLFEISPETGYSGNLTGKKATIFYTAGVFTPGVDEKFGLDFHSTYMEWWLNMIGVTDISNIRFQPSNITPDPVADQEKYKALSRELASKTI